MSSRGVHVSSAPLTSKAWNFFRIHDGFYKVAKCKLCQKLLSYRTSVTNLLKHVRYRHKQAFNQLEENVEKAENHEISAFSLSENEDDDIKDNDSEDNRATKHLEAIETKNNEESVCLLCQQTFSDQSSTEMMQHMINVHNISQIKLVNGNVHLEQEESKPVKKSRMKRSLCWDYFIVKDKKRKMALCNLCDAELSYKTTVSNLIKHLKRRHHIMPNTSEEENSGGKVTYKPRSAVWSFFNYVNDDKTVCACVHCDEEFDVVDGLKDMKKHLVDKHAEALLHHKTDSDPLFITTNDDNSDGMEEENLQEEYLEFDDLDVQEKVKHRPSSERRFSFERKPSFARKRSFEPRSSLDVKSKMRRIYTDPIVTQNKVPAVTPTKLPNSLEHFSKYVTSLLQELPDKISKKLQMKFIKDIIEAQISCVDVENTKATTTRKNSSFGESVSKKVTSVTVEDSVPAEESVTFEEQGTIEESVTVEEPVTVENDIEESVTVKGETNTNTVSNNSRITIANGIIIRPVVTASLFR